MDSTINLLQLGLDGAMKRQKAISNNIANVDTPGYKRKDVDFISVLKKEVGERQDLNIESSSDTKYRNDGNNVDIDYEMAEMAKTNLYYNTLAQRISGKFNRLNEVISKGGK